MKWSIPLNSKNLFSFQSSRRFLFGLGLFWLPLIFLSAQDSPAFPAAWQGKWEGTLEIFGPAGLVQSLPMELHILPVAGSAHYSWAIIYGEDKAAGLRPYELQVVDAARGLYRIDEKNSIVLEGYWLGGVFVQVFSVNGSLLLTTTEMLNPDVLLWEILAGRLDPVSTTGGTEWEGEAIPEVQGYLINVLQRARLYRRKEVD